MLKKRKKNLSTILRVICHLFHSKAFPLQKLSFQRTLRHLICSLYTRGSLRCFSTPLNTKNKLPTHVLQKSCRAPISAKLWTTCGDTNFFSSAFPNQGTWRKEKEKGDVQVFSQREEGLCVILENYFPVVRFHSGFDTFRAHFFFIIIPRAPTPFSMMVR